MFTDSFKYGQVLLFCLLVCGLTACSMTADGLVPDQAVSTSRHINKSIKVMPVEGGRASSFGREAYITNEQFHEALSRTLVDSKLFEQVVAGDDAADYDLHSEIITITTESGVSPQYAIVVQYWLVDAGTKDEIWRKGINTRHQVMWNEAFSGATRIIRAVEGATKKNLAQVLNALARADVY